MDDLNIEPLSINPKIEQQIAAVVKQLVPTSSPDVIARVEDIIKILIVNILSVTNLIAKIHNAVKIGADKVDYIDLTSKYIGSVCPPPKAKKAKKPIAGGAFMGAEYFGNETGAYTGVAGSAGFTDTIDFNTNMARAGNIMSGGGITLKTVVGDIYRLNNVAISRAAIKELTVLIKSQIDCLIIAFAKHKTLTVSKINTIIAKDTFKVFH